MFSIDLSSSLADILKVTKSVYGQKKQLEKSLKSSAGISLDRVCVYVCLFVCLFVHLALNHVSIGGCGKHEGIETNTR